MRPDDDRLTDRRRAASPKNEGLGHTRRRVEQKPWITTPQKPPQVHHDAARLFTSLIPLQAAHAFPTHGGATRVSEGNHTVVVENHLVVGRTGAGERMEEAECSERLVPCASGRSDRRAFRTPARCPNQWAHWYSLLKTCTTAQLSPVPFNSLGLWRTRTEEGIPTSRG